jgi:uncharacterized protein (TIGR03437 family)
MRNAILIFSLVFAGIACGQTLTVTDVITTGPMDRNFAPGTTVYILGSFPHPAAGRDFSITVGGQTGGINVAAAANLLTAPIPIGTPAGSTTLTVTWQGKTSNAFPVTISALAPEIDGTGVTVGSTAVFNPYHPFQDEATRNRITPSSPASIGEPLSISVYGLGQNTAPSVTPTLTVAGVNTQIAQIEPGSPGRETIIFFVPQSAPLGVDPVVVTVAGVNSNTASLPVGTAPAIGAVLNAASFGSANTVSPGSIVSIFGASLGSQDNASAFPSTNVNGTTVLFGSTAAPVFAALPVEGQLNVLVPTELPDNGTVNLTVQTAGGTSSALSLNLVPATPAAFAFTDPLVTSRRNAAAVAANTAWIAMPLSMAANMGLPSNCSSLGAATLCGEPAHPGDYLQIYATGLGKATPNGDPAGAVLPTGQVAPASGSPLYATVATPSVTIGGLPATVVFSGIGPGYAGLYQLDVQIPAGVTPGDDVPLAISMPGSSTDTTTIAIAK